MLTTCRPSRVNDLIRQHILVNITGIYNWHSMVDYGYKDLGKITILAVSAERYSFETQTMEYLVMGQVYFNQPD